LTGDLQRRACDKLSRGDIDSLTKRSFIAGRMRQIPAAAAWFDRSLQAAWSAQPARCNGVPSPRGWADWAIAAMARVW